MLSIWFDNIHIVDRPKWGTGVAEPSDPSTMVEVIGHLQLVLDALPRAIILVDLDAVVVAINQVAERLYGWPSEDAVGRSLFDLIAPPELRAAGSAIMADVLGGTSWNGDIRVVRRDGVRLTTYSYLGPVRDFDGRVVGAIGAADDVTDVRRLEREASDLADHLLLALEAGRLGTWRWDIATGVTTWDATMCALFGVAPDEFDGTYDNWASLIHPDDRERVLSVVGKAVEDRAGHEIRHRVTWADGTLHWFEGRGRVILDDDSNAVGTIGCGLDITERMLAMETSARRVQDAERTARRETLQRERLEFLVELNDVARNALDHGDLMQRAAAAAVPRLGDWCTLHFVPQPGAPHEIEVAHCDPERVEWAKLTRETYPFDPDGGFGVPAVMRSGRTEFFRFVDRYLDDPSTGPPNVELSEPLRRLLQTLRVTSVITVPLLAKRGIVGAIQFVSAESGRRYDDDDVALAEAAAGRVAAALDATWLAEQQRNIASTLQAALLPNLLPDIAGVSVAVRYWAAGAVSEVGGDFYDVFPIGDRAWAVVIGDVCGTGPEAAAITAIARHTIRAAATHGASPVEVMHWTNDAVLGEGEGRFCTLLYSTLEPLDDGTWRWVCVVGGHPLPLLVARDGTVSQPGAHGTLIGALKTIAVTSTETILVPGSTVVLHTDGVNDVRPPYSLDDAQLMTMVADAVMGAAAGADDVAERIGRSIEDVLAIPERDDDVAIVVLRVL